jgi:hypothetical protein
MLDRSIFRFAEGIFTRDTSLRIDRLSLVAVIASRLFAAWRSRAKRPAFAVWLWIASLRSQ